MFAPVESPDAAAAAAAAAGGDSSDDDVEVVEEVTAADREAAARAAAVELGSGSPTAKNMSSGCESTGIARATLDQLVHQMALAPDFMAKSMKDIRVELSQKLGGVDLSAEPMKVLIKVCVCLVGGSVTVLECGEAAFSGLHFHLNLATLRLQEAVNEHVHTAVALCNQDSGRDRRGRIRVCRPLRHI